MVNEQCHTHLKTADHMSERGCVQIHDVFVFVGTSQNMTQILRNQFQVLSCIQGASFIFGVSRNARRKGRHPSQLSPSPIATPKRIPASEASGIHPEPKRFFVGPKHKSFHGPIDSIMRAPQKSQKRRLHRMSGAGCGTSRIEQSLASSDMREEVLKKHVKHQ